MKKINFDCIHCEARRPILVEEVQPFYITGHCLFCKSKITINRKRLDIALAHKK